MAAGERGTQRQNREDGKRPLPISPAAFQVAELRQLSASPIFVTCRVSRSITQR
jgi:hypothetical protein